MKNTAITANEFAPLAHGVAEAELPSVTKRTQRKASERREFQIVLWALFFVFLIASIVTIFLPAAFRPTARWAAKGRSVIGEAKAAANEVTPFIFWR
ncbi:MAG: hypothetical protein AAF732_06590 [Pseudomonadota bacterium]